MLYPIDVAYDVVKECTLGRERLAVLFDEVHRLEIQRLPLLVTDFAPLGLVELVTESRDPHNRVKHLQIDRVF